jgi:hypothetical protein
MDCRLWRALACVFFALAFAEARATSVLSPNFDALVDRADLIFTGQMVSQRSEWRSSNGQKSIVTLVSFAVEEVHKGKANSAVVLQFLGGSIGEVSLEVAEVPKFRPGERVVLFVEGNGLNASPLVGFYHGKFSLQRDNSGTETVLQHNGEPLGAIAEIGRAKRVGVDAASGHPLSRAEFVSHIQRRVAAPSK